jgi:NTP pyrophosphatase (non-canonical NTP hydrolase)
MTHLTRTNLENAIADARRGHRIHEYERVADHIADAAEQYIAHVEGKRAEQPKTLEQMQTDVTEWCERKGWKGEGSAPVTFGDTMALLHSEVSEALEAYRDWGLADATAAHSPSAHIAICAWRRWAEDPLADHGKSKGPRCDCEFGADKKPEGIGSEFADVLIRLLDDCDRWGVDLRFEFERKMAYNEKRPHQHGGRIL